MIRLAHPALHFIIPFEENQIPLLTVEEPALFRKLVWEMTAQTQGQEGSFVLSDDWVPMPIEKSLMLVTDAFDLNLNERRLMTTLHKDAGLLAHSEKLYLHTAKMKACITDWLTSLELEMDYPITYDGEIEVSAVLKAANLQFDTGSGDLPELLERYIQIVTDFSRMKLIMFTNLHSLLSSDELDQLYRSARYRKARLLLLESRLPLYEHADERRFVVDKDLCELYSDKEIGH